jgi:hypothetical protein
MVAIGGYLRFDGLPQAGIFGVDDGRYILDGLAKANEMEFALDLLHAKRAELKGGPELLLAEAVPAAANHLADPHPFSPKLGYAYAIAAVLLNDFTVSAGNYVEAFFGTVLILITFGYVRYVHNAYSALAAAAFIALSAYCVYFSRNTYPQCISACFVVAAIWLHAAWLRREAGMMWLFIVGVFAGLSFWTNYQATAALPLIAIVHACICVRRKQGVRTFVLGGVAIAAGFAFLLIGTEALSYPMILLFRSQGIIYPQATFFEVLWPRLTGQTAEPFNASGLVLFPYFFGLFHGWAGTAAIALILGAGIITATKQPTISPPLEGEDGGGGASTRSITLTTLYFGIAFAVPFALFSLKTMQGARMFMYALPFFAALFGVAATHVWSANTSYRQFVRTGMGFAIAIALISNAIALHEIRAVRSVFPEVIAFVEQQDEPRLSAAWSSTVRSYAIEAELDGDSLYRYLGNNEKPPRWFVNDWQELYDRRYPDEPIALAEVATPSHTFDHQFDRIFIEVEALPSHGNTFENLRWVRNLDHDRVRKVLIYDLETTPLRGEHNTKTVIPAEAGDQ